MQPLQLTLKGFRGIRDGMGRDALSLDLERLADGASLIAIAGANGRGKTTVMDNMHPYLTMPSRAAQSGPGGFSYYDHVFLPENEKQLTWAHEGRCYRSQVVIRINGRRRTEAYLHVLDDAGRWSPARLADGVVSDGKVDTYTRCVEAICGSAETFFTSVFSAQGKRQLNTYRNAEIKALLADLLAQDEIQALGQKAGETARLLKVGLAAIRQELTGLDTEAARLETERHRLGDAVTRVQVAQAARLAAQTALDGCRVQHARLDMERGQAQSTDARRTQLLAERTSLIETGSSAINALKQQDQAEGQRLERLEQRISARLSQERARRSALGRSQRDCLAVLQEQNAVRRAVSRLPLAEHVLAQRAGRTLACREEVRQLAQVEEAGRHLMHKLATIEQDAGKAALREQELTHRFGLVDEVPCAGSNLQARCKLLGDAREAQVLIPSAKSQIAVLAADKAAVQASLQETRLQRDALAAAPQAMSLSERRQEQARARVSRMALLAAKAPQVEQARSTLRDIESELAALGPELDGAQAENADERAERMHIARARHTIADTQARQAQHYREALDRLDVVLAALPPPFVLTKLQEAEQALAQAETAARTAEQSHLAAERDAQALHGLTVQGQALTSRRVQIEARLNRAENSLSAWSLFARCMSNDGLIALAIDDAGPALSGLANDLLLACYGPRFTVSILTLVETGKGEQREGFDILVHDGESGESKSVSLMSGGERVWVNECLTRAVALYLAEHSGRRYDTLYSDEADGALDPERKRMFMAMKREVLRLGGYQREFFVSQTPELTAMADVVIDLDAMRQAWEAHESRAPA